MSELTITEENNSLRIVRNREIKKNSLTPEMLDAIEDVFGVDGDG